MKRKVSVREYINDNGLLVVGAGLMVFVYLMETLFVSLIAESGFANALIPISLEDFVHRVVVQGALLGFLVFAWFTLDRRRRAEEARARLASIVENSNDAIIARDLDGRITDWNEAVEKFYGYSADELSGQHVLAVAPFELEAEEKRLLDGIRRGEMLNQYETVRLTKDGRRMDVSLTTSPIKDSKGDLTGYSTVSRDITKRKRAEEALRESERRLRAVVSSAPVVLFALDREGVFLLAEGKGLEPLEASPDDLLGGSIFELYADAPGVENNVRRALEGEEVRGIVEVEGLVFDVWYSPLWGESGEVEGVIGVATEVTERVRAEERVRRYAALMDLSHEPIFVWDPELGITEWNKGCERLYGYSREEAAGQISHRLLKTVHPTSADELMEELRREGVWSGEVRHTTKSGEEVILESRHQLVESQGRWLVLETNRDITERKRVEEKLQRSEAHYRAIVEDQTEMVCRFEPGGALTFVNKAYCDCFGGSPEEIIGYNFLLDIPDEDRGRVEAHLSGLTPENPIGAIEHRAVVSCGEVRWLQWDDRAFFDEEGRLVGYQSTGRDVTDRREAEAELRRSKDNLSTAQRIARLGSWEYDVRTDEMWWSEELYRLFGFDSRGSPGTLDSFMDFVHSDDRERLEEFSRTLPEAEQDLIEHRIVRPDGETRVVESYRRVERDREGDPVKVLGVVQDVTERRLTQKALQSSETSLNEAQRIARLGSWEYDAIEDVATWSQELYRIFGVDPQSFVPKADTFLELVRPEDKAKIGHALREALRHGRRNDVEYRILRPDGRSKVVHARFEMHRDASGRLARMNGTVQDVTERKELEEKLEYQAYYDHLTGLPNQNLFLERLKEALSRSDEPGRVAVVFLDLDDFKVINNSLSHEVGDRLLVAVAERLRGCVRAEDTVARFGGDSFTFLFQDMSEPEYAIAVAERIQDELRTPFVVDGRELFVTAGMGIGSNGPGCETPEDLLRAADVAMHRCKATARDCYEVFREDMNERARERLELESDLRRAIEREEFRVFYQPVIRLRDGEVVGMEALVRWQHPRRGLLAPGHFIPHAEESGLIVSIGEWVLREACRRGREWQERSAERPLTVGVNLSARQFQHPDLARHVARVLEETGFDPGLLVLEITESVLMEDARATVETLEMLRGFGVKLAIDDFGTGYSSLSYLTSFPVDVLKVDRSFVSGVERDSGNYAILAAAINLGHAMEMRVIGEGVETECELRSLEALGCDLAQGYYFAKPLPPEEAFALVRGGLRETT